MISGAIMGSGAGKRLSAVRWGVAGNIFAAWLLTVPAAAGFGALTYGIVQLFGSGALGPVVIILVAAALMTYIFGRRARRGAPVPAS